VCETEHPNPNLLFVFGSDLLGPPLILFGVVFLIFGKRGSPDRFSILPLISSSFQNFLKKQETRV
jgi:hypothetical protein